MTDPDSILRQAKAAADRGDRVNALGQLRALAALPMASGEPLMPAAFTAFQLGDLALAETLLRRVTEMHPDAAPAHLNLGNVLQAQGNLAAAATAVRQAIELAPGNPGAYANLGAICEQIDRPDEAEAAYRKALTLMPDQAALHDGLGRALAKQTHHREARAAFQRALQLDGRLASAHFNMGNSFQDTDQLGEAEQAYRQALALDSGFAPARSNLALVLQKRGQLAEAARELRQAIRHAPSDVTAHINLATVLFDLGDAAGAVGACDAALALDPANRTALSFKAIALMEAGQETAARQLLDVDRFMRSRVIDPPPGYATLTAFNAALFDSVSAAPDRLSEPGNDMGRQTADLMIDPQGALQSYRGVIDDAVAAYVKDLDDDPGHPFVASRPAAWDLVAWGTVMREIAVGESSHIHPPAWLSGVYYAHVPDGVGADDPEQAGWIEFCRPPVHIRHRFEPAVTRIRPQEGLLVLFPSYFYHRILPFKAADFRMSVAFDAVPRPGSGARNSSD